MVYIYGLACPDSGAIRYIGKSENPPKRLRAHISSAVRGAYSHHTARWLKRLVCAGKAPALKILHAVREDEDWREVERQWIAAWADPEVGAKLRAIHASPEVRAKKSEGAKRRSTPEYRAMMAERTRLSWEKRRNQTGA